MPCPVCLENNECRVKSESTCWCSAIAVPDDLLALVPQPYYGGQCLCRQCVERYVVDKEAFIKQFHLA